MASISEWVNGGMFDAKLFLKTAPHKAGVYQMLDLDNCVIYVGKAKDLKKRLASYFNASAQHSPKTRALVAQIVNIVLTVTHTEIEALILENTLIKTHQPRYNILLRDDKSYPYLYLSAHRFPRLSIYRGAKRGKGRYFGPYPQVSAAYESLNLLQKIFPLRTCEDSVLNNRSRPCLQYQIKRCTAPCVGLIDEATYQEDIHHAVLFLEGKSNTIIKNLVEKMEIAAKQLAFEKAAVYRDQISRLSSLQSKQYVDTSSGEVDVIAVVEKTGLVCVQVLTIRGGRHLGSRAYFPKIMQDDDLDKILLAFLPQYYFATQHDAPKEIVLNRKLPASEINTLIAAIQQQRGVNVQMQHAARGTKARWLEMVAQDAETSLSQRQPNHYREQLAALTLALGLDSLPQRMECFDISHTQGEATVASCVVFDGEGICSSAYRRFNIEGIVGGDDYAAMQQALQRRFTQAAKHPETLPDVLFIDGGKGQVKVAQQVLTELNLAQIRLVGVAKGTGRKAGLESLILPERAQVLLLAQHDPALHLIQQIRDEAHRFAITAHRQRRQKRMQHSVLENIAGIGAKRRQNLLNHFGGLQGVARAGVEDLARVSGISEQLAQQIYDFFTHP